MFLVRAALGRAFGVVLGVLGLQNTQNGSKNRSKLVLEALSFFIVIFSQIFHYFFYFLGVLPIL